MSVVARAADGSWETVVELGEPPAELVASLLVDDLGVFFELEVPAFVVATAPPFLGAPDAICITPAGEVVVIVVVGADTPESISLRLRDVLSGLAALSPVQFVSSCDQIGLQHTPGSWVAERSGSGDAVWLDREIARRMQAGTVAIVVAARHGHAHVALPIAEVRAATKARIRCFELGLLGAAETPMVEASEVSDAALASAAKAAERDSNARMMLVAVERELGATAVPLAAAVLRHCEAFFARANFRAVGELVVLTASLSDCGSRQIALELDSAGTLAVRLENLDPLDRRDLARSVAGMVDADVWPADDASTTLRLSLLEHLGDISLVEQFLGALSDALLSTMSNALVADLAESRRAA